MVLKVILLAVVLVGLAIAGLALKILVLKNGKFPETHISRSPHMKAKGITCVKTHDRMEQMRYNPDRYKGMHPVK
jgi:hypothetical protein